MKYSSRLGRSIVDIPYLTLAFYLKSLSVIGSLIFRFSTGTRHDGSGHQKVVGVAPAAARGTRYLRERLAYVLREALRQEGVELAQAVEIIGYVDEAGLDPSVQQGAETASAVMTSRMFPM